MAAIQHKERGVSSGFIGRDAIHEKYRLYPQVPVGAVFVHHEGEGLTHVLVEALQGCVGLWLLTSRLSLHTAELPANFFMMAAANPGSRSLQIISGQPCL